MSPRRWAAQPKRAWPAVLAWVLIAAWVAPAKGEEILLVHLPSAPVEAAGGQAEAITTLAEYLNARLPEQDFELKIFRRWHDAQEFLDQRAEDITLMLSDASFALGRSRGLIPAYRFERDGRSTYRRLLVVRDDRPELEKLVDLRGKTLALVETSGTTADVAFLEREVFEGEIDPVSWFATVAAETDDFSATASVLYGKTDAALVAEYNPLLADHLGQDLRVLFESPELSLPVLSVRETAFEPSARAALGRALEALSSDALGQRVLAELGIENMGPLTGATLARESKPTTKTLAIASTDGVTVELDAPPLPAPELLSFAVAVELPEIPLQLDKQ